MMRARPLELGINIKLHGTQMAEALAVVECECGPMILLVCQSPHTRLKSDLTASDITGFSKGRIGQEMWIVDLGERMWQWKWKWKWKRM
jgi:hypothetical protein